MRIETIKLFFSIVETGSFSGAAKMHHLTQPAVTAQIQSLEFELGKKLFNRKERRRNSVLLSKEGAIFCSYAQSLLDAYDSLLVALNRDDETEYLLTVATSPTNGTYIFPYLVESFKKNFPHIRVNTAMESGKNIHKTIINGSFDIGITTNNQYKREKIIFDKLISDPIVLIARSDYPIRKNINIDQLKILPLAIRSSGETSISILDKNLHNINCSIDDLNVILRVYDNESVKQAVRSGLSVGFVTLSSILDQMEEYKIIRVQGLKFDRNIYIMRSVDREYSNAMKCFWHFAISKEWIRD